MENTYNPPKLSIIMAVRNAGNFINRALRSIVAQHYPNLEVIIFDGLSTDSTLDIIKQYSNIITILRSEADTGVSDAQNKGIALATGDYIGFLNADDEYAPGAFWAYADAMVKNPEAEVITAGITYKTESGRIIGIYCDSRMLQTTLEYILIENQTFLLSRFIKPHIYKEIGLFNTDRSLWYYSNDREWTTRLVLRGCNNVIIPKALYDFTVHDGGMSSNPAHYSRIIEEHMLIAENLLRRNLSPEQVSIVQHWRERQLVFGFWQALLRFKFDNAIGFFRQGWRLYGLSFPILCVWLFTQKLYKRIMLRLSNKIDNGIVLKSR